jgi:hypothetical protein
LSKFSKILHLSITLTDEQRLSLKAIDVNNKVFVEDTLVEHQTVAGGIMPAFINATTIDNDLKLYEQLDQIEIQLQNALQRVSDLKRLAGDEVYGMSLAVYKILTAAAAAGIPGAQQAYDKLKVRFEAQGGGGRTQEGDI